MDETQPGPAAEPTTEALIHHSGSGQDVFTLTLEEGVYYCRFTIKGNCNNDIEDEVYDKSLFSVRFGDREGGSRLLASAIASQWTGRAKVVVGGRHGLKGVIDVEVEAEQTAKWELACERQ